MRHLVCIKNGRRWTQQNKLVAVGLGACSWSSFPLQMHQGHPCVRVPCHFCAFWPVTPLNKHPARENDSTLTGKKNSSRVICSCGLFTILSPFCGAEPTDGSWQSWRGGGVCWRGQGIQSVPQLGSPDAFVSTRPEECTPGLKKKAALRCQSSAGPLALSVGVEDSVPFSKEMIHLHRCHLPKHHSFSQ